jgi:ABC-2 type transport system permease protein
MTRTSAGWIEVIRFELAYQLRRKATWFFFAVFLLPLFGQTLGQMTQAQDGEALFNAPIVLAQSAAWMSLVAVLIIAAVAGDAATRDIQLRVDALMHTSPLGRPAYLGGRFLGVFILMALLLTVVPLASLVFPFLHPDFVAELAGPTRPAAYLQAYLLVTVPNAFVATALLFALATLVRHILGAWIGALLVAGGTLFSAQILGPRFGHWTLATFLDPAGATGLQMMKAMWSPLDVNARLIGVQPALLMNRGLWITLAVAALGLAYSRFHWAGIDASARPWRRSRGHVDLDRASAGTGGPAGVRTLPARPAVRRDFGRLASVRQTMAVSRDSLRELITGWTWLLIPGLILLILTAPAMLGHLGVPFVPTTDRVLGTFRGPVNDIRILLALLAGELVWRDRDAKMQGLADAAPVANTVRLVGQLLGLWFVTLALHGLLMVAGVAIQVGRGVYDFEPAVYLQILFGLDLAQSLVFGLLALSVHVLVNHKHVGHLVLLLLVITMNGLAAQLGIEHPLLVYGTDSGWRYSRISGFDPFLGPVLLFKLYWAAWTLVLAILAWCFWMRGVNAGFGERVRIARWRFTRTTAGLTAAAFTSVLLVGGFIFYNTNILNAYRSSGETAERRAEYERQYRRHEGVPQPHVTATELHVDLYPHRRAADVRGVFTLENRTTRPIDVIHVAMSDKVQTRGVVFDRPVRIGHHDDELGHHVYGLDEALAPGATLRMTWSVHHAPRGFSARRIDAAVVRNGSFIPMHEWMPHIGYREWAELTDVPQRMRHGLPERPANASLHDVQARHDSRGQGRVDLKVIVGTAADQIAVAPGALRRTWQRGDRRYFEYVTNAPVAPGYAIFSADYATWKGRAGDVALEILHHPAHDLNADRMMRSMQASLEQYERRFGPYPYDVLRMVEYPSSDGTLHAAAGNIWYQELFSLLDPAADAREIDVPFAVVAHEVAHQFQPPLARVEGRGLLSEAFAWYAAFGVIEDEYGPEHLERFLGMMREAYDAPRSRAGVPLLRATDWFDSYRRGPAALYALQAYVGREKVDLAWRRLIDAHRSGEPPLATSLDLYRELQAVTPDSLHGLLGDLFERNTIWELETSGMAIQPIDGGRWRVTVDVSARKTVVDEDGRETEVPMDDPVEVGVYGEPTNGASRGKTLHRQMHRVRSGAQHITVEVAGRPAEAAIDPRRLLSTSAPR